MSQAVRWRLIAVDPAAALDPPGAERPRFDVWHVAQPRVSLAGVERALAPLLRFLLLTGLRVGEVRVLHWEDTSLGRGHGRGPTHDDQGRGRQAGDGGNEQDWARSGGAAPTGINPVTVGGARRSKRAAAGAGAAWIDMGLDVDRGNRVRGPTRHLSACLIGRRVGWGCRGCASTISAIATRP